MLTAKIVTEKDSLLLFNWANDELTRNNSINKEKISIENHTQWMNKITNNREYFNLLFENEDNKPVGLFRVNEDEKGCLISFLVDPHLRGKGYGKQIVLEGISKYTEQIKGKNIRFIAFVNMGNVPSVKIFQSLGFNKIRTEIINKENYLVYELIIVK